MNIVGAMDTATKGTVMLDGHDISDLTADELTEVRCRTIGLVFQQFHLIGHLTALENVMVAQYYHSMPDEKEALEALDRVGLADRASHLPRQLSGGEQQRVCVARALMGGDQLGQGVRGQKGNVAVGDDDGAGDGFDGVIEGLEATLDGAAGAGNLILVGDDGGGTYARDFCGDNLALVAHDGDQMLGVEAVSSAQSVSDHGQARQGVNDLGEC